MGPFFNNKMHRTSLPPSPFRRRSQISFLDLVAEEDAKDAERERMARLAGTANNIIIINNNNNNNNSSSNNNNNNPTRQFPPSHEGGIRDSGAGAGPSGASAAGSGSGARIAKDDNGVVVEADGNELWDKEELHRVMQQVAVR